MIERGVEYLPDILPLFSLALPIIAALTSRQRNAILERDDYQSQMRHYNESQGWFNKDPAECERNILDIDCPLQVHHIDPQRNGGGDVPENLISLLECEHNGKCSNGGFLDPATDFVVHPDMIDTFEKYRSGNANAFQEMFVARTIALSQGEKYHNDLHDEEMLESAEQRTEQAAAKGWQFPGRRRR